MKRSSRYGVGKEIGGAVYIHREYESVLPAEALQRAKEVVPAVLGGDPYTLIKYDKKTGALTFIWCQDFDTVDEPTMGIAVLCTPDETKYGGYRLKVMFPPKDPWIYHHKWLMVRDDYAGFNVLSSKQRTDQIERLKKTRGLDSARIGKLSYWNSEVVSLL
jgi:hypothetical protein